MSAIRTTMPALAAALLLTATAASPAQDRSYQRGLSSLSADLTVAAEEPAKAPEGKADKDAHGKEGHKDEHAKDGHKGDHKDGHKEHEEEHEHEHEEPSDLFLRDFFKEGWNEKFEERERKDRAPRFNLFKSRQGFLERIAFGNYAYTNHADEGEINEHELGGGFEWAFNRRFQIGVEPFYTWQRPVGAEAQRAEGLRWEFGTRFQLIDTKDRAYNFQVHVVTPLSRLGQNQTELAFALAGFEDLTTTLGLKRVGLYHHIEYVTRIGPSTVPAVFTLEEATEEEGVRADIEREERHNPNNLLRYDVSLAKTFTEPTQRFFGDFTLFIEAFGETRLDGDHSGRTEFTFTPGLRFNPTGREEKAWWLQAGIEFPVTGPRPFSERVLVSVIHDF